MTAMETLEEKGMLLQRLWWQALHFIQAGDPEPGITLSAPDY